MSGNRERPSEQGMLVFRPKKVVGHYQGFEVILASQEATQNSKVFDKACETLKEGLLNRKL